MELPNPDPVDGRPEHGGRDRHVAFTIADLQPLKGRLDGAGVAYTMSKSGRAALFCRDLDGNAFEVKGTARKPARTYGFARSQRSGLCRNVHLLCAKIRREARERATVLGSCLECDQAIEYLLPSFVGREGGMLFRPLFFRQERSSTSIYVLFLSTSGRPISLPLLGVHGSLWYWTKTRLKPEINTKLVLL